MDDQKKIALVTGASRGLGAALALALAGDHHVIAVARTSGGLEELDDRIKAAGGSATLAPMDITKTKEMAQLCRSIYDRWRRVDIWLHTAIHAAPMSPAAHMETRDLKTSLATNVTATHGLITMVEPLLAQAPEGMAVFFDDPHAGEKFFASYGASKAAQMAIVRSWLAETAKSGPRVIIFEPAPMPTATRARFYPGEDRAPLADPNTEAARLLAKLG